MASGRAWSRRLRRGVTVGAAVTLVAFGAASCAAVKSSPDPPLGQQGQTAAHDGGNQAMRDRLSSALSRQSTTLAQFVSDPQTTLTTVSAPYLPGWTVIDALNESPPHPRRTVVGLPATGPALVLSGRPDHFQQMLTDAAATVPDAATAVQLVTGYLDATRDQTTSTYRIDSVDEITWRKTLDATQGAQRDAVLTRYRSRIAPPQATAARPSGWTVEVYVVHGLDLVRHTVQVTDTGKIDDQVQILESDLAVPYSG